MKPSCGNSPSGTNPDRAATGAKPPRSRWSTADDRFEIELTDDGSLTLVCRATGDRYHSGSGAAAETRHVYLRNSGVAERCRRGEPTRVLELGFGTGMAFLMTLDAALDGGAPLHYEALEQTLLPAEVLASLRPGEWVCSDDCAERFLAWRVSLPPTPTAGRRSWTFDADRRLVVHLGDAGDWLPPPKPAFHAIYFDPFAPASNPDLWRVALLERLSRTLLPGGKLVTYCVSRSIREVMASAGLAPRRVPGPPGGKREVLVAEREG